MRRSITNLSGCLLGLMVLGLLFGTVLFPGASSQDARKSIHLQAVPGLQYNDVRFAVKPGQTVTLTLENASSLEHNLVISKPGTRRAVVAAANRMNGKGPEGEYVPRSDDVLHFIPVLAPDSSATITFSAPSGEGVYPYVCTYPGHGVVMYGAMYVSSAGEQAMPPLEEDSHVPPKSLRVEAASVASTAAHPYPTSPPMMYRTFMPESSPASIAVGLKGDISYCFDTVPVSLRYAWKGGFIDNREVFRGHVANQRAKIEGEIFFRNEVGFPLRVGDPSSVPEVEFEGYRMVNGRPQFRYTMAGLEVQELITPLAQDVGLRREFRIERPSQKIQFVRSPQAGINYESSAGTWRADTLQLRPEEAQHFVITMRAETGPSAGVTNSQNRSATRPQ